MQMSTTCFFCSSFIFITSFHTRGCACPASLRFSLFLQFFLRKLKMRLDRFCFIFFLCGMEWSLRSRYLCFLLACRGRSLCSSSRSYGAFLPLDTFHQSRWEMSPLCSHRCWLIGILQIDKCAGVDDGYSKTRHVHYEKKDNATTEKNY